MDREEILEKSRKENKNFDERDRKVQDQAGYIATFVGGMLCAIFTIINMIIFDRIFYELWAVWMAMQAVMFGIMYFRLKRKKYLVTFILDTISFICFILALIFDLVGI